ncbi:MAG: hypothetical protein QCI38_04180 [Candidatus Thermoplasmatota archaeon]|nr:hypothetical protein [Candidatus Thermoplasmatota archaeon]
MGKRQRIAKASLKKSKSGALEGLPLYMVILVVIAAVSMVVLLGWMSGTQSRDLDKIVIEPNDAKDGIDTRVVVSAYDSSGNKLEGVIITLDGCGVHMVKQTTSRGEAVFNFTPNLLGDQSGTITVTGEYTGTFLKQVTGIILVT